MFGIDARTSTILDQMLTNIPQMVKTVQVLPPVSTNDHCTIAAKFLFRKPKCHPYKRTMWDFKNANFDLFCASIAQCDWDGWQYRNNS